MKIFSSKRRLIASAFILLALFLIRPGASRLKSRIIFSISAAVGRPVDIGSVHIQLLPRPAFDLENLVVYDDPAYGAEPMLRASQVTAALRLTSLMRGHLEISRLDLTEPSLNLAHQGGHWNVESLLQRTALTPLAPTAKRRFGPRPAFPYIEATSGRINFKNGPEKRPYALTNADFSLWQESDNSWGLRLKAQPFSTEMNLNDMGLLQATGTWQRAEAFQDTPLQVSIEWTRAQLGQLTKFITGNDQGWRGGIVLDVALQGTPAKLQITSNASIDDFRRYDITSGKALHMAAYCDAQYSSLTHEFRQVMCNAPVGAGLITLTGDMGLPGSHRYSVAMTADNVPAAAAMMLARRVKKNLPDDLEAEGTVHATVSMQEDAASGSPTRWQGRGEIADFHLISASNKAEIGPEKLPFVIADGHAAGSRLALLIRPPSIRPPQGAYLGLGPLALGARAGSLRGWLNRSGYSFEIAGDGEIGKMLRLGRMVGLPAMTTTAEGSAQFDLKVAGSWRGQGTQSSGFTGPQVLGSAKLRNVQIAGRSLGGPVDIVSADMQLLPNGVRVEHLNAKAAGTSWSGSIEMPRGCANPAACSVHFTLKANQLALGDVNEWLHPSPGKRPWYRLLESSPEAHSLLLTSLHAVGQVTTDRFQLKGFEATHVSANLNLGNGRFEISGLSADLAGGQLRGEWKIDFAAKPPVCKGTGNVAGVSLAALADEIDDGWVEGTGSANYEIESTCSSDFWPSAQGTVRVEAKDAVLTHVQLGNGPDPFRVSRLTGQARLHDGTLEIKDTKLISPEGTYQLTGTASLNRELDLKLARTSSSIANTGYTIAGTLSEPHVTPLSAAMQARLKSISTK